MELPVIYHILHVVINLSPGDMLELCRSLDPCTLSVELSILPLRFY